MPTTVMFDGGPVEFNNMDKTEVVAVVPSSGMVRDSEGQIIGCQGVSL